MTPKEYLDKLEQEMLDASPDTKDIHTAVYVGAKSLYDLMLKRAGESREKNREKIREYNREYQRARRAKQKKMKEDIDGIAEME